MVFRTIIFLLIACVFSSCAIHNKFPFICFFPDCIRGQFDMKPLKRKMQMAMGGKKRKFKSSLSSSKNNKRNNSSSKNYDSKNTPSDTTAKNTIKEIGRAHV